MRPRPHPAAIDFHTLVLALAEWGEREGEIPIPPSRPPTNSTHMHSGAAIGKNSARV